MKKKSNKETQVKELYVFFHSPSQTEVLDALKGYPFSEEYPANKFKFTLMPTGFCPYGTFFIVDPIEGYVV